MEQKLPVQWRIGQGLVILRERVGRSLVQQKIIVGGGCWWNEWSSLWIRESSSSLDSLTNEVGGQRPVILDGWMLDMSGQVATVARSGLLLGACYNEIDQTTLIIKKLE